MNLEKLFHMGRGLDKEKALAAKVRISLFRSFVNCTARLVNSDQGSVTSYQLPVARLIGDELLVILKFIALCLLISILET